MRDDTTLEDIERMLDRLFRGRTRVPQLDVISQAEVMDLPGDVGSLFSLVPPGSYSRRQLTDQLNVIIVGHGLASRLGTLD